MHVKTSEWQKSGSVLAFPHNWQRPAKTEEWAYERCLAELPENKFAQVLCFPWATLIDLQRKGKKSRAGELLAALQLLPPKTTLIRATVMQHIYAKDALPLLKRLGVTDLFWCHATKDETHMDGIRVHPFPLYPVCCAERADGALEWQRPEERRYLYSFIGTYQPGLYLSEVRRWIFDLPTREDAYVERRNDWHFERAVYGEQIDGRPRTPDEVLAEKAREDQYREIIAQSLFSLCPSGSGPNTIRLWESLHLGAIPVVISDRCRLPGDPSLWERAVVTVSESPDEIRRLPERLSLMTRRTTEIHQRLTALRELSKQLSINQLPMDFQAFFSQSWRSVVGR